MQTLTAHTLISPSCMQRDGEFGVYKYFTYTNNITMV